MPRRHAIAAVSALLLLALASSPAASAEPLVMRDGWVRQTPPNRDVAAGYLHIENPAERGVVIVGARSPQARVEVHEMRTVDGMMRMRPLEELAIPAGGSVSLAPGGTHLMLYDVDATRAGTVIEVTLVRSDGIEDTIPLPVRRDAPASTARRTRDAQDDTTAPNTAHGGSR